MNATDTLTVRTISYPVQQYGVQLRMRRQRTDAELARVPGVVERWLRRAVEREGLDLVLGQITIRSDTDWRTLSDFVLGRVHACGGVAAEDRGPVAQLLTDGRHWFGSVTFQRVEAPRWSAVGRA